MGRVKLQNPSSKSQRKSFAPEALDVGDAVFDFVECESRAEFEHFDVIGFYAGLKCGEIDFAGAGCTVITAGKLDIVNVETGEMVAQ